MSENDRGPFMHGPVLVALGTPGQSLSFRITGPAYPDAAVDAERGWLRARIEVEAFPFTGVMDTVLTPEDVDQYRAALRTFPVTGHAVLGGGRASAIELISEGSVIEVVITPFGDDPWPSLRYLIFPFPSPWAGLRNDPATARAMERELAREVTRGHVLDGLAASAIARREDRDDVLFGLAGGQWAIVHLIWQAPSAGVDYPITTVFDTWEAVSAQMRSDTADIE